ncbi:MAG: hypothetical protein WAV31_05755 [Candidatus Moraniibacteriota bacterium]
MVIRFQQAKTHLFITVLLLAVFLFSTTPANATSGCCSWHGGVSHCDTSVGKYVCNDGSYSPSCGCTYIPPKPKPAPIVPKTPVKTTQPQNSNNSAISQLVESTATENASKLQELQKENDNLKDDKNNLQSTIANLNKEKADDNSFGGGFLFGAVSIGGLAWYINKKRKQ